MTASRALAVAAAVLILNGCGDGGSDDPARSTQGADVQLEITAADRGGKSVDASLRCDGDEASASGFGGADAKQLCRIAVDLAPFLARAPDPERVCTQIYGGPQTAHVTGTIRGRRIDRRFARNDGCAISDWDHAKALLPIATK